MNISVLNYLTQIN